VLVCNGQLIFHRRRQQNSSRKTHDAVEHFQNQAPGKQSLAFSRKRHVACFTSFLQHDAVSRSKHQRHMLDDLCSFVRSFFRQIVKPTTFINQNERNLTTFVTSLPTGRGMVVPAPKKVPKKLWSRSFAYGRPRNMYKYVPLTSKSRVTFNCHM
jgi:hypothetical protein